MNTVLERDQSVVLHNISWNSYRQISDTLQDETSAHFTFDRGQLEIMVLSLRHEYLKKIVAMLFERLAENLNIEIFAAGSTTFRREDISRGFEPDECYYVENARGMRGKDTVNLDFDPPPDLTIEIDVKHSSLDRMGIFAAMGIPEVWRYDGEMLEINLLVNDSYTVSDVSGVFTGVASVDLQDILKMGQKSPRNDFLACIDAYTSALKK